jgi:hypothetical protein
VLHTSLQWRFLCVLSSSDTVCKQLTNTLCKQLTNALLLWLYYHTVHTQTQGSPVSYQDLRNAGLATVSTVIVLSPKQAEGVSPLGTNSNTSGDASARQREMTEIEEARLTVDGDVIVSFVKMSDGLLRPGAQVILELQHEVPHYYYYLLLYCR